MKTPAPRIENLEAIVRIEIKRYGKDFFKRSITAWNFLLP